MSTSTAEELLDKAIAELEAKLNLKPGEPINGTTTTTTTTATATATPVTTNDSKKKNDTTTKKEKQQPKRATTSSSSSSTPVEDLPEICKLEFKVGIITKVWVHEKADKLYCEEIDVGEDVPRQIASGLRQHFTEEQMLGQRLLVVSNLKAKNLVGFKSHGMVLCAAAAVTTETTTTTTNTDSSTTERVEFVEPPIDASIGEVIVFDGLPKPQPATPNQVEKQKLFQLCMDGMKSNDQCQATWNGHVFMTSAGPCTTKSIKNGPLR